MALVGLKLPVQVSDSRRLCEYGSVALETVQASQPQSSAEHGSSSMWSNMIVLHIIPKLSTHGPRHHSTLHTYIYVYTCMYVSPTAISSCRPPHTPERLMRALDTPGNSAIWNSGTSQMPLVMHTGKKTLVQSGAAWSPK